MSEGTKRCIFCAEEIQAAAKLCRFCNREQNEGSQAAAQDQVFFEGPVMHRTFLGEYILYGLIILAGLTLTLLDLISGAGGFPWWIGGLVIVGVGGVLMLVRLLKTVTTRWKITSRVIQYERGILSKNIETVDLWRIKDISYTQSLWERIINEAKIHIVSNDESDPKLTIVGMINHRQLYEKLREAVEVRRRGRVLAVESPDANM